MSPARRVWAAPVAVGACTVAGLGGALLLEGWVAQAAACLALAVPVAVVAWKVAVR